MDLQIANPNHMPIGGYLLLTIQLCRHPMCSPVFCVQVKFLLNRSQMGTLLVVVVVVVVQAGMTPRRLPRLLPLSRHLGSLDV